MLAFLSSVPARGPRPHRLLTLFALVVAALIGPACNDATAPNSLVPSPLFTIVSGNGQTAAAGKELPAPIVAQATNSSGTPLPGITVSFVVTNGGGKLYAGTGVTNSSGLVQDYWTLGPVAGQTQRVQVRVVDPTTGNKELYGTFSATAVAGPAAIIKVHTGDGQTGFTRSVLPIKPVVMVTDVLGNRVAGVSVTFAVAPGGGSISGSAGITNANGTATVGGWRLGRPPGTHRLTATASGLSGSPVTFTATAKFGMRLVETGILHSCGLSAGNDVYCWGWNQFGTVGDATTTDRHAPVRLGNTSLRPPSLALGYYFSCLRLSTGKAYCWGYNEFGSLGDETNTSSSTPVAVSGGHTFTHIAAGLLAACGRTSAGEVWCWGHNGNGEFGNNSTTNSNVPVKTSGEITFSGIYRGGGQTCALTPSGASGNAWCWGENGAGQVGDGDATSPRLTPSPVALNLTFTSLELGQHHSCGLVAGGKAYCWGWNFYGQVGNGVGGVGADALTPVPVHGGIAFTQLAAGQRHTCGITSLGVAYCWGDNTQAELGTGSAGSPVFVPTLVAGGPFSSISAGTSYHTCGVPVGGGNPFCWGYNEQGQLGNGTTLNAARPAEVLTPAIP